MISNSKTVIPADECFHPLSYEGEVPSLLNNPFYYQPSKVTMLAVEETRMAIDSMDEWRQVVEGGCMFGVMVVRDSAGHMGYLRAFSGQINGSACWRGWVPPVFDYLQPDGYFKQEEASITSINHRIAQLEQSDEMKASKQRFHTAQLAANVAIQQQRERQAEAKRLRDEARANGLPQTEEMIRESQFLKAEVRRAKQRAEEVLAPLRKDVETLQQRVAMMQQERRERSDKLQDWLFRNTIVTNGEGNSMSMTDIFSRLPQAIPPSGAGECCAPKLLQYALVHGYAPVSWAEFWLGRSPKGEIRHHGNFYPACMGKCYPVLQFMLRGVNVAPNELQGDDTTDRIDVVYEDQYMLVADKPAGMLSAPGKGARQCILDILRRQRGGSAVLLSVHRLDMQTSGLIIVAKTVEAQRVLHEMFATRQIKKRYDAILDGCYQGDDEGEISLPLSPDYINRPRQRVDWESGKPAITHFKVVSRGTTTHVQLFPATGRTHQLRVHCASVDGLALPIVGDDLYGTHAQRLMLNASLLDFIHPFTGEHLTIESNIHLFTF